MSDIVLGLDEVETLRRFKYSAEGLLPQSSKMVVFRCVDCGTVEERKRKNVPSHGCCKKCGYKFVPRENYTKGVATRTATNQERYGRNHPERKQSSIDLQKATNQEKYGGNAPMCSEEIQAKARNTSSERFGTPYAVAAPATREKARATMLERHGVEYSRQSPALQAKAVATVRRNFGVDNPGQHPALKEKALETTLERYGTLTTQNYGAAEETVVAFIETLGLDVIRQYKIPGSAKSIDCFIPSKMVGVEYCGLYWHSEARKPNKQAHRVKMDLSAAAGIQLVTLFEHEWLLRRLQTEERLRSILRISATVLMARKCRVEVIEKTLAEEFIAANHLQGAAAGLKIAWGMFSPTNELVGVASFKHDYRYNAQETLVLQRLCFKARTEVTGGAGRLVSAAAAWARENRYASITSWSDNRWSTGGVYRALGFEMAHESQTDYGYVDLHTHRYYHKQTQQKQKVACPEHLTELEWATERGLVRIWDCGHRRWELKLK